MTVLSGAKGKLLFNGTNITCRNWFLNIDKTLLENTDLSKNDKTYITTNRDATGRTTIFYDALDNNATAMLNTIFTDNEGEKTIEFIFDTDSNESYIETGYLTKVSQSVTVGDKQICNVEFQLSDNLAELEINGATTANENETKQYFAAVDGIPATSLPTYAWIGANVTFDDPNNQNPLVTFNTAGTVTLQCTATLQDGTVLVETITVEVSSDPIFWTLRRRLPESLATSATLYCRTAIDPQNGFCYFTELIYPTDGSTNYMSITKTDENGNVIDVWRIKSLTGAGWPYTGSNIYLRIMPVSRDLWISVNTSYMPYIFRITKEGNLVYAAEVQDTGVGEYVNIRYAYPTSDEKYLIHVTSYSNRLAVLYYNIEDIFAPNNKPKVWQFDNGNFGIPYSTNKRPTGEYMTLGLWAGDSHYIVEFAPLFGGDIDVDCQITNAYSYSQDKPGANASINENKDGGIFVQYAINPERNYINVYDGNFDPAGLNTYAFTTDGDYSDNRNYRSWSSNGALYNIGGTQMFYSQQQYVSNATPDTNLFTDNNSAARMFTETISPTHQSIGKLARVDLGNTGFTYSSIKWTNANDLVTTVYCDSTPSDTRFVSIYCGHRIFAQTGTWSLKIAEDDNVNPTAQVSMHTNDATGWVPNPDYIYSNVVPSRTDAIGSANITKRFGRHIHNNVTSGWTVESMTNETLWEQDSAAQTGVPSS